VAINDGSIAPTLAYDNGTACGSAPAGFNTSKTRCNGEWIGLGSFYNPNGDPNGVYFGSGSSLDFIQNGSADQLFLNALGDFAWTDGRDEEMYELIQTTGPVLSDLDTFQDASIEDFDPVTTPEPRSLLLVATGLVWVAVMLRRSKANRYRSLAE
jgi:hypothetical protein